MSAGILDTTVDITVDITSSTSFPPATLVQVKGKWYAQVTIPLELRAAFNGRKQERRSLGTADKREAERLLHAKATEIYAKFKEAKARHDPLAAAATELITRLPGYLVPSSVPATAAWQGGDRDSLAQDLIERTRSVLSLYVPQGDPEDAYLISKCQEEVDQALQGFEVTLEQRRADEKLVGRRVSAVAREFFSDTTYSRQKTQTAYERGVGKFIEFAGDVDIGSVDKPMAVRFADHLGKTLSNNTLQRDIGAMRILFGQAEERGMIANNPFAGLNLRRKGTPVAKRLPFRRSQLEDLFALDMPERDRLCLSVLAATGMRLDEVALLEWSDIREEGGIAYFDLQRVNKLVKNGNAARQLPVPAGLRLPPVGAGRIFDYRIDEDGKAENAASKALMRHVRKVRDDPTDRRFTVHSLRHSYKDAMREAGIASDMQDFLMGHQGVGEGGRYGSGPSLAKKSEAVELIDLSFLPV